MPSYDALVIQFTINLSRPSATSVESNKKQQERPTRKLSYRKDDRAMRPRYGCADNFRESMTAPTAIFPEMFNGFCAYECAYKIWSS